MKPRAKLEPLSRGDRGSGEDHSFSESLAVGFAAAAALLLVGCGERPQVINYKQGTYQGKPDQPAWDSAKFNGDRTAYELAIKQRAQSQNEYKRIN